MSVGPTRGPVQRPGDDRNLTEIFQRLEDIERLPPGRWIYVGTYPGDPDTTPDSPPFENGWSNVGGGERRLRFRRNQDWSITIAGVVAGGASGTTVCTLNPFYRLSEDEPAPGVGGNWLLQANGHLIFTVDEGSDCCDEIAAELAAHIADPEDAHEASAIGYLGSSDLPRDNVQDAIDYLLNLVDTGGSGVVYGTPAIVLGTVAGAGSIAEAIRRDATIVAFDATVPTTQAFGDAAATGVAAVAARRDHKHAMPANPFSGAAAGGALSGTYPNPGIAAGAVGAPELAATAVTPGTYGTASAVGRFTVDADGRITAAADVGITGAGTGLIGKIYMNKPAGNITRAATSVGAFSTAWQITGVVVLAGQNILLTVSCAFTRSSSNNDILLAIFRGTTQLSAINYSGTAPVPNGPFSMTWIDENPGAGTYTYEVRGAAFTSGTLTVFQSNPTTDVSGGSSIFVAEVYTP